MKNKNSKWVWYLYVLLLIVVSFKKIFGLLSPESPTYLYFYFLRSFDPYFYLPYYINIYQTIISLVAIVPIILWAYQKEIFPKKFWQILFVLKILLDILGQTYERLEIVSYLKSDVWIAQLLIAQYILFYAPLYITFYKYAFGNRSINKTE